MPLVQPRSRLEVRKLGYVLMDQHESPASQPQDKLVYPCGLYPDKVFHMLTSLSASIARKSARLMRSATAEV